MKAKYSMTETQVEALAEEYATATGTTHRVGMTYLRVLVTACQSVTGNKKTRGSSRLDQSAIVEDVANKYYAAVLRGVTTSDIAADVAQPKEEQTRRARERNRRSTFARASKSVLAAFVKAGGDLRELDAETVTRDPLAKFVRESRGERAARFEIERRITAIIRIAGQDPETARLDLGEAIEALQNAMDALSPSGNVDETAPAQEIRLDAGLSREERAALRALRNRPLSAPSRVPRHAH